ncbi:glycosyltransferase family 4 protein, partial [Acinetobacter baumannii]
KGGALETVNSIHSANPTGAFFDKQEFSSVIKAVEDFERNCDLFLPVNCRNQALKFSNQRFHTEIEQYVQQKWIAKKESMQ